MQHWSYEKKPSNAGRNSQQKVFQDMQSPVRQSLPGSGTGLGRESFGKARSQPLKIKPKFRASYSVPDTSADERRASQLRSEKSGEKRGSKRRSSVPEKPLLLRTSYARPSITQLTRKRSRSATDLNKDKDNQGKALRWSRNLGLGATSDELEEAFVTRHMLYKEAMYTGYSIICTWHVVIWLRIHILNICAPGFIFLDDPPTDFQWTKKAFASTCMKRSAPVQRLSLTINLNIK